MPVIGARTVTEVASRLLARRGLSRNDIDWWAIHPGGTVVLAQVAKELGLGGQDLRSSYNVFENYGNMSSPSVLFVLRDILDSGRPQPGQKGMLLTFGTGFSTFAALVEFAPKARTESRSANTLYRVVGLTVKGGNRHETRPDQNHR